MIFKNEICFRVTIVLLFSCILSSCVSQDVAVNKSMKPLACWQLDDVAGTVIKDSWGANDAELVGIAPENMLQNGVNGKALYFFDGQNYLEVPHSPELSLTDEFTIECIVKPFDIKGYNTIIWKGDRTVNPQEINYYVDIKDGEVELKGKKKDGKWFVYSTSKPVVEPNKWYNIVITWNRGRIGIYVNGQDQSVQRKEQKLENGRFVANDKPVMIGCGRQPRGVAGYPFNGLIDEVKIFGKTDFVTKDYLAAKEQQRIQTQRDEMRRKLESLSSRLANVTEGLQENGQQEMFAGSNTSTCEIADKAEQVARKVETTLAAIESNLGFKKFYQKYGKAGCPFMLSVLPTSKRVVKKNGFYNDIDPERCSVKVNLARNEYDGFQVLAIGNPYQQVEQVKVEFGKFMHENGQDRLADNAITVGWIKDIKTEEPDIPVAFSGAIPDAIMDGESQFDIAKGSFTPVFFRVYANSQTKPGMYHGTLSFSKGKAVSTVFVSIRVYDFELPKISSLKIAFSFFNSFYKKWYGYSSLSETQHDYINQYLLRYRVTPNNIYSRAPVTPSIDILNKFKADGANFCTLKYHASPKVLSNEKLQKLIDAYQDPISKLKQNGLYENAYFYSYDELEANHKKRRAAKQYLTAMRKAYPDLKCLQTSVPLDEIAPLFNCWCPLVDFFTLPYAEKLIKKARARGDEIWWYMADDPPKPFPNFFLDYPVFDSRIIMTMSYMYDVKGILYWCINREWLTNLTEEPKWPKSPWKSYIYNINSKKRVYKNGMGNYVYPGPNGKIYPSLRLENLRDGIEDYEYLNMLKTLVARAKKKNVNNSLIEDAEKLLNVPGNVAKAVNNYSSNPEHLLKYRQQVAEMIEALKDNNL